MTAPPNREDVVRLVKENADIVSVIGEHVKLRRSGMNFKGLCPFHAEKTPSFMVHPERQTFHCFGCSEGGDVFSFVTKYHNLSFPEALKELAERFNITLPERALSGHDQEKTKKRQGLLDANERAASLYHRFLLENPAAEGARRYLEERGVPQELVASFRLGFAPDKWDFLAKKISSSGPVDVEAATQAGLLVRKESGGYYDRFRNRILFPIVNLSGQTVGFGGRIMGDGQPKYLNSPESLVFEKGKTLYGLYQNREAIRQARKCLVVEGNFDLVSLVAGGFKYTAAPLGTALTPAHIRILKGYSDEVILLFDGDDAGVKAAARSIPLFLTERVSARVVILPGKHDPDTFLKEFGPDELEKKISSAMSMPEFFFESLVRQHGLSVEGKSRIAAELAPVIAAIDNDQMQRTVFISHFSERLGIAPEKMTAGLRPALRQGQTQKKPKKEEIFFAPMSVKERQLLEFLVGYPEFVSRFLSAGIEEMLTNGSAAVILTHLKEMVAQEGEVVPEHLLERVTGPPRSFISEVLLTVPHYSAEKREAIASEMLNWLKREGAKVQRESLIRQITEAQQANDETLYMELMEKMRGINDPA